MSNFHKGYRGGNQWLAALKSTTPLVTGCMVINLVKHLICWAEIQKITSALSHEHKIKRFWFGLLKTEGQGIYLHIFNDLT